MKTLILLLALSSVAQAQQRPLAQAGLPRGVEARLTAIIEDPATRTYHGETRLAEPHAAHVVVFNGRLTLGTRIDGQLIVVDGDVRFEPGAAVSGDVAVIGGDAYGLENADVTGTITIYDAGPNPLARDDRVYSVDAKRRRVYRDDDRRDWGRSTFSVGSNWNYNRVEGLPVHFGPVIETGGRNPTRVEALAIWRTEVSGPFDTDDWGYSFRAEQFLGGQRDVRIGASLRSAIEPIESWQIERHEASLATFVLHDDQRDYFEREGWSAYVRFSPRRTGLDATIAYNDDDFRAQPARDPWTLFNNGDAWRLQPFAAEGRFRSVSASLTLDRRGDLDYARDGFYVGANVTRGIGGSLEQRAGAAVVPVDEQFTRGWIDARLYRGVTRDAALSFRVVAGGALSDHMLPPQFQHALGGAGSLPGYALFSGDCGARTRTTSVNHQQFYSAYGCDRMAMFSAEYRGEFDLSFGDHDDWDEDDDERDHHDRDHDHWSWDFDASPDWILFFDAGRGWAHDAAKTLGARDTQNLYDVGAGIVLGDVGVYGTVPLTGGDRGIRFFVRLGPRF